MRWAFNEKQLVKKNRKGTPGFRVMDIQSIYGCKDYGIS